MDFVIVSTGLILPYWMGLPIRYIQYDDRYGEITVYSFYSDVWTFILEQPSFDNPKKLTCGFYVDCMDIKTMEKFLKRKINFLDWKEVKTINL